MAPGHRPHGDTMATRRWPLNWLPAITTPPRPAPPPRRVGPLLALAFFALYALTSAATLTSKDGGVMYDTAMAIVNRHTLALPPHHHGLPGVNGGFYSKYGIAQSVAEIPLFAAGQALAGLARPPLAVVLALAVTMLITPLIMALAVWLFFLLAYELWPNVRGAALAAVLVGAASPYWPYAKTDFSEPLSALALSGAVLFLLRARTQPGYGNLAFSGLFVALALLTKLTAGLALPALGLYALFVAITATGTNPTVAVRRLLAWAAPIALGFALVALYDVARYGRVTDTGYSGDDLPFKAPLGTGLEGLLISTGKGLLWYCPLLLLALALWPLLLSRRRAEGLLTLGIVLPTLAVYATYPVWWGGICWGPRYLVPVLPLLLLPLGGLLDRWPRAVLPRRAIALLVTLSVAVQVVGVAVHPARFLVTGISDAQYLWMPTRSPLLGQAWLVAYDAVALVDKSEAAAMIAAYPWRQATGTSIGQRLAITQWNYWWWQILGQNGLGRRGQAIIAALLLLALAAALWALRGLRQPAPERPFDHRRMAIQA